MRNRLEAQFRQEIVDFATIHDWLVHYSPDSRKGFSSIPGFPDLVMARGERVIFAELKVSPRKPTPEQWAWLNCLRHNPAIEVYVWYSSGMQKVKERLSSDDD